jgi:FAD/FMN-containing dehydrogenase
MGTQTTGEPGPVQKLAEVFSGEFMLPADPSFDQARRVWNAMIDKRPSLIVRPRGTADVLAAVGFARQNGLPVAVRCGGHSVAGKGVCDDGLLIDLSAMKGVRVDPIRRTARANAGVLWGEYDHETQTFGLASPGGRVTTTGIGGFTLGGGYGWLSPKYGLACDNLVSADVVTADGRLVVASEDENQDLFWGLRGGSSNWRGHLVRVPPASGRPDHRGRHGATSARAGRRGPAGLPRLRRRGPGRAGHGVRALPRAAGAVHPRAAPG